MSKRWLAVDEDVLRRMIADEGEYESQEAGLPIRCTADIVSAVEKQRRRLRTPEGAKLPPPTEHLET